MSGNKGFIINGGNFSVTNMVNGNQIINNVIKSENIAHKKLSQYEVVFSFAGEDRSFIKAIAAILASKKVNVFYDEAEQIDLWGKNLKDYFKEIFGVEGLFCVIFISSHYLEKKWCRYELELLEAREHSEREYVLPITLDGNLISDWAETKAYLDGRGKIPEQVADYIFQKIYMEMKKRLED